MSDHPKPEEFDDAEDYLTAVIGDDWNDPEVLVPWINDVLALAYQRRDTINTYRTELSRHAGFEVDQVAFRLGFGVMPLAEEGEIGGPNPRGGVPKVDPPEFKPGAGQRPQVGP